MRRIFFFLGLGVKSFLVLGLLSMAGLCYASPFTLTPVGNLPPLVMLGNTVAAAYTVVNNTSRQHNNIFVNVPPNVTVASGGCGSTFNLAAGASCILNLTISGYVNAVDPNPQHHLYVCLPGGTTCTGTNYPLNVQLGPSTFSSYLYLGNNDDGSGKNLCPISPESGLSSASCRSTGVFLDPQWIAFSLSGLQVYVSDRGYSPGVVWLCSLDPFSGTLSGCQNSGATAITAPAQIVLNATGTQAYITDSSQNNVVLCNVNLISGILSGCEDSGAGSTYFSSPKGISVNAANTFAYITNSGSGLVTLCAITPISGQLGACMSTGTGSGFLHPNGIVLTTISSPSSTQYYAYISDSNNTVFLCTVNQSTGALSSPCVSTGSGFTAPSGISVISTGMIVYVANQGTGPGTAFVSICNVTASTGDLTCPSLNQISPLKSIVGLAVT